jgi:hypothetical protein
VVTETWAQFAAGTGWTDGDSHGNWVQQFVSAGTAGIETDNGAKVFTETPQAPGHSSYSALLTSTFPVTGAISVTLRMKTVSQSRGTPNPWERAWFLWNYTDTTHFYYVLLKANGWEVGKEDPGYPGCQRFLATGSSPTFAVGNWNTVQVRQAGNVITVGVDDSLLVTCADTERPYLAGSLGLYCEDSHARFGAVTV